jgi:hypothetical protein
MKEKKKKVKNITVKPNKKGRHIMGLMNFLRVLVIPFYYIVKPFRFYGTRKVADGACLYVCNHYTLMDAAYPACTTWEGIHYIGKKEIPADKLNALIEYELKARFGISSVELMDRIGSDTVSTPRDDFEEYNYPFPTAKVKNWDALRKHAAEMLCFADPVKYDFAVRRIRVSNKPKEIRAYLLNMYRYDGVFKYACQMCHDPCASIDATQLFNKPDTELDPLNLCLCPNCAAKYHKYRNNESLMNELLNTILEMQESEMGDDYVVVPVGDAVNNIHGMITLNGPAEIIWKGLEEGKEYDDIVAQIKSEYDAPEDVIRKDLDAFLDKLKNYKILE